MLLESIVRNKRRKIFVLKTQAPESLQETIQQHHAPLNRSI